MSYTRIIELNPNQPDASSDSIVPAAFAAWRWTPLTMLAFVVVAYLVGQWVGHPAVFILSLVVLSLAAFVIGKYLVPERIGRPVSGAIIGMSSAISGVWLLSLCRRVAHSTNPEHSTGLAIGLGILAVASLLLGCLLLTAVVLELFEPDVRKQR
jgi:hypothetical protein